MRDNQPYDFDDSNIEYDPTTEEYHLSFRPEESAHPSMRVVEVISYITDTSPFSLSQLHSAVDTDSLDSLLKGTGEHGRDLEFSFTYAGYQIRVSGAGELWVQPIDDTL